MYSREDLIKICEDAIVQEKRWNHRDTPLSIAQLGRAWAFLKCGCRFEIFSEKKPFMTQVTNKKDIYFSITHHDFDSILNSGEKKETEMFYLPTPEKLQAAKGGDWNKI